MVVATLGFWYVRLSPSIKEIVARSGFSALADSLQISEIDGPLIYALAKWWWDTTHTSQYIPLSTLHSSAVMYLRTVSFKYMVVAMLGFRYVQLSPSVKEIVARSGFKL
ncbi:hypothetical protein L484_008778 [Morus notabilis]|uniref:Aminotransferase-like plant mobile domain-containing protein n=1 Tax=Morus notabilis TaxID=981085 RepID=W9SGW5_9ROSA|nr:hypothetical protein L484_008778 [Morus notabilis]